MKDKNKEKGLPAKSTFTVIQTGQCLKIDKNKINFCKYPIFASSFKQLTLIAELMDYFAEGQRKQFHMLKLKTIAQPFPGSQKFNLNKIFTLKAVENGQEVSDLQIPIKDGQPMTIFIRASIPELLVSTDINGVMEVQIDQLTPLILPIMSKGEVPQIVCLKQLQDKRSGIKIIKVPSKGGIMKIPFKNCSNINFSFEVKLVSRDLQKPDADGVRINVMNYPPQEEKNKPKDLILRVDANSAFCVQLELQMFKKDNPIRIARRILVLQVQGTKLLFPFPLEIIITS